MMNTQNNIVQFPDRFRNDITEAYLKAFDRKPSIVKHRKYGDILFCIEIQHNVEVVAIRNEETELEMYFNINATNLEIIKEVIVDVIIIQLEDGFKKEQE